jgi:hypothetical protein
MAAGVLRTGEGPLREWGFGPDFLAIRVILRQALLLGILRGNLLRVLVRYLGRRLGIRRLLHQRVAFFTASFTLPAAFLTLPVALFTPPLA